jgi:uncharacterized protein YodC (DUF2158 family)
MAYKRMGMAILLLSALLSACATPASLTQNREAYVQAHPELSPQVKEAILRGEAAVGMTPEQVTVSCGGPNLVTSEKDKRGKYCSLWGYKRYTVVFGEDNKVIEVK